MIDENIHLKCLLTCRCRFTNKGRKLGIAFGHLWPANDTKFDFDGAFVIIPREPNLTNVLLKEFGFLKRDVYRKTSMFDGKVIARSLAWAPTPAWRGCRNLHLEDLLIGPSSFSGSCRVSLIFIMQDMGTRRSYFRRDKRGLEVDGIMEMMKEELRAEGDYHWKNPRFGALPPSPREEYNSSLDA